MKRFLLAFAAMAIVASCAPKEEKTAVIEKHDIAIENGHFTPEIMHQLGKVSDVQVSPDGTKLLYGVTYTSIEENKGVRNLFIMDIDGGNNRQLTHLAKSASNARWLDDDTVLFLNGGQLWKVPAAGGKAVKVSDIESGINEFELTPDGKGIVYSYDFKVAKSGAEIYPDVPKSTARTIEGMMYRHWDHFVEDIPHTCLAKFDGNAVTDPVDLLGEEPYELPTAPFSGLEDVSVSPDCKYIAYSCRKKVGRDYAYSTNTDIYLYDVESGETLNLTEGMMGYDTAPAFSPDGKYLAWCSMERDGYEADRVRLFVRDMSCGERHELTGGFIYDVEGFSWSEDSQTIYFNSIVEGTGEIWKTDLNGNLARVTPQHELFDFGTPKPVGDKLIATNTSMLRPAEIVSISLTDGSWQQISHENDEIFAQLDEIRMEEFWVPTSDGKKMLTWALFPPKFDENGKYPAILFCNGGPQSSCSQSFSTRWNFRLMASQGYVVIIPNRRGNVGFGQEWKEQISGDYIGQNMKDYLAAADFFLAKPYVGKMGATGASYGGYSIYYLAGIHQNRFSALIAHAGIFNQESMYMNTEEMWFPDWDNGGCRRPGEFMAGSPWSKNPAAVRHYANSAHKLVDKWTAPILVTHGELDYRVPVEQGMMAFNAAQMFGVPSKMLLFPDENHWILKPQNSIHWNREFFAWFDKYLKD
ncbi:MAG: S9 family peptidase [Bacteroidales bacterium]|nr:S9 family peptidase [Bacteroidales bacterium]